MFAHLQVDFLPACTLARLGILSKKRGNYLGVFQMS